MRNWLEAQVLLINFRLAMDLSEEDKDYPVVYRKIMSSESICFEFSQLLSWQRYISCYPLSDHLLVPVVKLESVSYLLGCC